MPDIVARDRNGNPITHSGVNVLTYDTPDGGTVDFVAGTLVEKTVELDFSGGDMEVVPDEGEILSKVKILKPDNLASENIRSGETVAGIEGNLEVTAIDYIQSWQKTVTLNLPSSSTASTVILVPTAELPSWWPALGSMPAFTYNYYNYNSVLYEVHMQRLSGTTGSNYIQYATLNNMTGKSASNARMGTMLAAANSGVANLNTYSSAWWNTDSPGNNQLFQGTDGIGWSSVNTAGACVGTYIITLMRINLCG